MSIWLLSTIFIVWVVLSAVLLVSVCVSSSRYNRAHEEDEYGLTYLEKKQVQPQEEPERIPAKKLSLV